MALSPVTPRLAAAAGQEPKAEAARKDPAAWKAAQDFEATFLAEMLKESGVNAMPAGFGGGAGEEAFGSFLTEEYGKLLAKRGGVGIAEQVYRSLKQR